MENMTTAVNDVLETNDHRYPKPDAEAKKPLDGTEVVGPVFLAIISLLAGPVASGPLAGRQLHRMGYHFLSWAVGAGLALAGLGLDVGLLLWPIEQALYAEACSAVCGVWPQHRFTCWPATDCYRP
jgi:hypothetical protein